MKRAKKVLVMALACAMLVIGTMAYAPEAEANTWCHPGAADHYIGVDDSGHNHVHSENGYNVTYQGVLYKCAACNSIRIICPKCSKVLG